MPTADITVIFPYHNESKTLGTTLDWISRQTLMPREVVFVNSSSSDDSSKIIDNWIKENQSKLETKFSNIFENTNTPSSSKNAGIKRASTAWVAFMDCGLIFPQDWLQKQWEYVQARPDVDLVSGGVILTGEGLIDNSAVSQTYGYKVFRPSVPTTLVKKSVFDKTGLFLENRRAGYDFAWPLLFPRLGIKRGINQDVIIRYIGVNYGNSLWKIFKKSIAYAAPTVGIPYYRIPYYYLIALGVFLIAFALHPISFWFFLAAHILFRGYIYPIRKSKGFALIKEKPLAILTLPLLGIVIDAGRTLGIIKGLFSPTVG
jgi:glycosyltransferase involved in cell wall biosynthesis